MHFLFVDFDVPGTNEIYVDFKPRQRTGAVRGTKAPVGYESQCRLEERFDSWRKFFDNFFVEQDGRKMGLGGGFKTIHGGEMDGDFVIPLNESFEHCVSNQDFPRRVFFECFKAAKDQERIEFLEKYCFGSSVVSFFSEGSAC